MVRILNGPSWIRMDLDTYHNLSRICIHSIYGYMDIAYVNFSMEIKKFGTAKVIRLI